MQDLCCLVVRDGRGAGCVRGSIAGGFSPRARRDRVTLTHTGNAGSMRAVVPLGPGDTVLVGERWF
jgi:hypothetical protein